MTYDPLLLLYGATFVGVLLLVEGLYLLLRGRRGGYQRAMNRRMRMIASGSDTRTTLQKLRREHRDRLSRMLVNLLPGLDKLMGQAGMTISPMRLLVIVCVLWGLVFSLIRLTIPMDAEVGFATAALIGILLPYLKIIWNRSRRLKKFGEQLPDALDLIVRSLRAGHPVPTALTLVSNEMSDPAGTEFGIAVDEMTYGLDLTEALQNLSGRVPHEDLRYLVVTVQIQYMVGGNMAEVLANLSKVIRDRYQMFAKIKAITAEGRASAIIVGILPFFVAGAILLLSPRFFLDVAVDPLFWPLIGLGFGLMVLGQITIYRMVNFKF